MRSFNFIVTLLSMSISCAMSAQLTGVPMHSEGIDYTQRVGTDNHAWQGATGICSASVAPSVTTMDGRTVQMVESYQTRVDETGDIITQTVSLPNGTYRVGLFANAFYTEGRGFSSDITEGQMDVCYVFAASEDNRVQEFISVRIAGTSTDNTLHLIDNVRVTDGTLTLGLGKARAGTNRHLIQIHELTQLEGEGDEPLKDGEDVTSRFIVNPTPVASLDGWEYSAKPVAFDTNNNVAEFWNQSGASFSQTVSLPAGNYQLRVVAMTRTDMDARIFAGSTETAIATVSSSEVNSRGQANDWFNVGNGLNDLSFSMAEAGEITIGLRADATTGDHWVVWRNFQLIYYAQDSDVMKQELLREIQETIDRGYALLDGKISDCAFQVFQEEIEEYQLMVEEYREIITEVEIEELQETLDNVNALVESYSQCIKPYAQFRSLLARVQALQEPKNDGHRDAWEVLQDEAYELICMVEEECCDPDSGIESLVEYFKVLKSFYLEYLSEYCATEIKDGKAYYVLNVGTGQFLTSGNNWGTQISVGTDYEPYVSVVLTHVLETIGGKQTEAWRMRLNGKYDFWGNIPGNTNNSYHQTVSNTYLFRNSEEDGYVDLNGQSFGYLWNITANSDGYFIQTAKADTHFPNAATQYAGVSEDGAGVRFDLGADAGSSIDWLFIPAAVDEGEEEGVIHLNAKTGEWTATNYAGTYAKEWTSYGNEPEVRINCAANNMTYWDDEHIGFWTGIGNSPNPQTYTVSVSEGYSINGFSMTFTCSGDQGVTVTHGDISSTSHNSEDIASIDVIGMQSGVKSFSFVVSTEGSTNCFAQMKDFYIRVVKDENYVPETYTDEQGLIYSRYTETDETTGLSSFAYVVSGFNEDKLANELVIPATVKEYPVKGITDEALSGAEFQTLTISEGVESIGFNSFSPNLKLLSISLPASLKSLSPSEDNPFSGCPALTSIQVASENPVYDSRNNCNAVIETATNKLLAGCNTTVIPDDVTIIGTDAFFGAGFTQFTIPQQIVGIGEIAFAACEQLTAVTSRIAQPFEIPYDTFEGINSACVLYVPVGTKGLYEQTEGWYEHFASIQIIPEEVTAEHLQALVDSAAVLSNEKMYSGTKKTLTTAIANAEAAITGGQQTAYAEAYEQLDDAMEAALTSIEEYEQLAYYIAEAERLETAYGDLFSDEIKQQIQGYIMPLKMGYQMGMLTSEQIAEIWPTLQEKAKTELQNYTAPLLAEADSLLTVNLNYTLRDSLTTAVEQTHEILAREELTSADAEEVLGTLNLLQESLDAARTYANWLAHLTDELTVGKELTALLVNPNFDDGERGWTNEGMFADYSWLSNFLSSPSVEIFSIQPKTRFYQTVELPSGFYAIDADILCPYYYYAFLYGQSNNQTSRINIYKNCDDSEYHEFPEYKNITHRLLIRHEGGPLTIGIGFDYPSDGQESVSIAFGFDNFRLFVAEEPDGNDLAILRQAKTQMGAEEWYLSEAWDFENNPYNLDGVFFENSHATTIDLASKGITGNFPTALLQLPALKSLDFSNNNLTGRIDSTLHTLIAEGETAPQLQVLNLSNNQLTGNLGAIGIVCPQLTTLNASRNGFEAVDPALPSSIKELDLTNQQINVIVDCDMTKGSLQEAFSGFPQILLYENFERNFICELDGWWAPLTSYIDGSFRFVDLWGMDFCSGPFKGNNGALLTVSRHSYYGDSVTEGSTFQMRFSFSDGDSNFDTQVDVTDVQSTVNYILNGNPQTNYWFNFTAANLWPDSIINVQDAVCLVNKILDSDTSQEVKGMKKKGRTNAEEDDEPSAYLYWQGDQLILSTSEAITAADIRIETEAEVEWLMADYGLSVVQRTSSTCQRALAYSLTGAELPEGETVIARVKSPAPEPTPDPSLRRGERREVVGAVLSNKDAKHVKVCFGFEADGIERLTPDSAREGKGEAGAVYDLSGRRLSNPTRGLYIIDGHKVVVK